MKEELGHTFGSDSTFWISYEDLLRKYQHFDRTRLFRDHDWRSCQRWIGVEVPWKPQYNEKFHIKLAKESPLVLVLSQLDTRYFKGLQGQYNFRLQFRLHEEGRPGAEEYIVRSHGNYLMDRSVSVELPSVGPGSYVVFISIIGERDTRVLSTEDVIKREAKGREENEKLAQVGQAYDLAHSKAASHLERLSKVRKKAEGNKASESRRKERRKNWEKRQIGRDIAVKQKAKDNAKKARLRAEKRAKADAAAKEKTVADKKAAEEKAAAERAAKEERLKQQQQQAESKPKDSSVQTDSKAFKEEGSQTEIEADSASTTSSSSSSGTPQYTPQDSPSSQAAQPVENNKEKVSVPPPSQSSTMSGGPPPPPPSPRPQPPIELKVHCCPCDCSCKKPPPKPEETDYSSDSPVEDYENLYDDDDLTPTLRLANSPATTASGTTATNNNNSPDSEDEDVPDPWNAIAVIGFRVYSKDEDLELRVIMEGGALEQDGMGSLGEADLDNAVSNAAGQRSRSHHEDNNNNNNNHKQGEEQTSEKNNDGAADQGGKNSSAVTPPEPDNIKKDVPELRVTTAAQDVAKSDPKQGKSSSSPHEAKSAPVAGMAAYRTIIERKTSEFDRVMGKVKAQQSAVAAATTATPGSALVKVVTAEPTPPPAVPSVGDNKVDGYFSDSHETPQSPESPLERKTREVLFIRHKLQRGFLTPDQEDSGGGGLPDGQRDELPDLLTQLEKLGDLEARVISATKINKVMRALVKKNDLPRDEELSIRSRAYALLDEYELTLLVGDDDDDNDKVSTPAGTSTAEKDDTASAKKE